MGPLDAEGTTDDDGENSMGQSDAVGTTDDDGENSMVS
jgi:hypothetical protein